MNSALFRSIFLYKEVIGNKKYFDYDFFKNFLYFDNTIGTKFTPGLSFQFVYKNKLHALSCSSRLFFLFFYTYGTWKNQGIHRSYIKSTI